MDGEQYSGARWVTPEDIITRYGITQKKLQQLTDRGAWPCHRLGKLTRFSPDDQQVIAEKWEQHRGEDPPVDLPSWRSIAMKGNLTDAERDAVRRGHEASQYLQGLA